MDTATDQLSEVWILPSHTTPLYQLRMDVGDIHEVQIPTCSYRMGARNMGYGIAYIGIKTKIIVFLFLLHNELFLVYIFYFYYRYSRKNSRIYNSMVTK